MKKRVLSVLLIVALLVVAGIMAVHADGTNPDPATVIAKAEAMATSGKFSHYTEGETAPSVAGVECPVCGTNQTWSPLTQNKGQINSGSSVVLHYYVARENIAIEDGGHLSVGGNGTTHIYLNGSTITANGASGYSILRAGGGNVAIFGQGTMTQNGTAGYTLASNGGNFDIYGGTYSSAGGTHTFYTFNNDNGYFDIYGGSVDVVNIARGTLNIYGGNLQKVVGSTSTVGLTLQGNPTIGLLDMTTFGIKATVNPLTTGAKITVNANGVFTANDASAYAEYFSGTGYWTGAIADAEGKLSIGTLPIEDADDIKDYADGMVFPTDGSNSTQYCPACEKNVTWKALTASTGNLLGSANSTDHFYLAGDVERTKPVIAYYGRVCVHLNGNDYSAISGVDDMFCFDNRNGYGINVFDTTGGTASNTKFSVFGNTKGTGQGAINIYGGTYTCGGKTIVDNYKKEGEVNLYAGEFGASTTYSVYLQTGGAFNMYGGTISGKVIYATNANNTVRIFGGMITGTGIDMTAGALSVSGGRITKVTCGASTGDVNISGAPVIGSLELTGGKKVTIGAMTTGADITVSASGVFTTNNASAYAEYFSAAQNGFSVEADGETGALLVTEVTINSPADVIKYAKGMTFPTDGSNSTQFCPTCEEIVTWKALTADLGNLLGTSSSVTHYYLSGDVTRTKPVIAYYGALCVHLNNNEYTLEVPNSDTSYCFDNRNGYGINILSGKDGAATNSKFAVFGNTAGTGANATNVYGGTYTTLGTDTISCSKAGEFNFYDGVINNGTTRAAWMSGNSIFNLYGGECKGRIYSDTGARLFVSNVKLASFTAQSGEVEMCGAEITEGNIYIGAANLILSGEGLICNEQVNTSRNATVTVREDYVGSVYLGVFVDETNEPEYGKPIAKYGDCATSFEGTIYKTKDDVTYGVVADGKGGLVIGSVAVADDNGTLKWFADAAKAAEAALSAGRFVRLFTSCETTLNGETLYLDLNGQNMKISGKGTVMAKDSANTRFTTYGKVDIRETEDLKILPVDNFAKISDMQGVHFHYYQMKISGVSVKPGTNKNGSVGLYYKATWSMDETLKKNASVGVVVGLGNNIPAENFYEEYEYAVANGTKHKFFFYDYDGTDVVNGKAKTSVLINGIMKATDDRAADKTINDANGQSVINAAAFLAVGDEIIVSPVKSCSAYDVLALIQKNAGVTDALRSFYTKWNAYSNVEAIVAQKITQLAG